MNRKIEAKPTWYKGVPYDSKEEAKTSVLLDSFGFRYRVKPERFDVDDNGCDYRPDFALESAWSADSDGWLHFVGKVYVETKGEWYKNDEKKVSLLSERKGKSVLLVDKVLWPGLPQGDEQYDTTLYREFSRNMQKSIETKKSEGVLSDLSFGFFEVRSCFACDPDCCNITFSDGVTRRRNKFCIVFHDKAVLCVGHRGEPVIFDFTPCKTEEEVTKTECAFSKVCDIEKTRDVYLRACRYEDDGSGALVS